MVENNDSGQIPYEDRTDVGIALSRCDCGNDSFRTIETSDYLPEYGCWEGNERYRLCTKCGKKVECFDHIAKNSIGISHNQLQKFKQPEDARGGPDATQITLDENYDILLKNRDDLSPPIYLWSGERGEVLKLNPKPERYP